MSIKSINVILYSKTDTYALSIGPCSSVSKLDRFQPHHPLKSWALLLISLCLADTGTHSNTRIEKLFKSPIYGAGISCFLREMVHSNFNSIKSDPRIHSRTFKLSNYKTILQGSSIITSVTRIPLKRCASTRKRKKARLSQLLT